MTNPVRLVPPVSTEDPELLKIRRAVRQFLRDRRADSVMSDKVDSWLTGWDEDFTRELAKHGWLGITAPIEYGGRGRSHLERFAVTEELLAAGAPVAAHWIADRQIIPSLLKYGTDEQKRTYIPAISRGECYFAIGMSEPDSGSDLASVRTKATRVDGGWRVSGTKVWTSGAHRADAFICLARTAPLDREHRHEGLSQFIVDLRSPGVDVRPIVSMDGAHHFNEVVLGDVLVSDDRVFGEIGNGWQQVTSELAFERSGPERFLSTFTLLADTAQQMSDGALPSDPDLGRFVARITGLHHMSSAVAGALARHERADTAAAVVKILGTTTEGDIADFADVLTGDAPVPTEYRTKVEEAVVQRPGFTLRGGTNEILRGVVARGLGLR